MTTERRKQWYADKVRAKPDGICSRFPDCLLQTDGVHKLCNHHRDMGLRNKQRFKMRHSRPGKCKSWSCVNDAKPGFSQCKSCAQADARDSMKPSRKRRLAERRKEIRAEVLHGYGVKCVCCGDTDVDFLTIDHVDRYTGVGPRAGTPLYLWLKSRGFPSGFRVLCMNCNFALGKFGYCPHGDLTQPFKDKTVQIRTIRNRSYQANRNLGFKLAAFEAYGGSVCKCCGDTIVESLSIDHENNQGAEHRKDLKGTSIYVWLSRNGFPSGFQVLCMDCNCSKRDHGGTCLHVQRTQEVLA